MNKKLPVFFAVIVPGAVAFALVVLVFSPLRANAYAVEPVAPGPISPSASSSDGAYDFGNSFGNLVSPFTNFFNNIKNTGGNTFSVGAGSAAPGVTVTVNTQPYINQFDSWFYGFTGAHIEGLTNLIVAFFGWLFAISIGIVGWIVNLLKGIIKLI